MAGPSVPKTVPRICPDCGVANHKKRAANKTATAQTVRIVGFLPSATPNKAVTQNTPRNVPDLLEFCVLQYMGDSRDGFDAFECSAAIFL